jgi:hypothetical protein
LIRRYGADELGEGDGSGLVGAGVVVLDDGDGLVAGDELGLTDGLDVDADGDGAAPTTESRSVTPRTSAASTNTPLLEAGAR